MARSGATVGTHIDGNHCSNRRPGGAAHTPSSRAAVKHRLELHVSPTSESPQAVSLGTSHKSSVTVQSLAPSAAHCSRAVVCPSRARHESLPPGAPPQTDTAKVAGLHESIAWQVVFATAVGGSVVAVGAGAAVVVVVAAAVAVMVMTPARVEVGSGVGAAGFGFSSRLLAVEVVVVAVVVAVVGTTVVVVGCTKV